MKLKTMMVAALAALTFASCSKEDNNKPGNEGVDASLNINVTSKGAVSRAVGTIPGDQIANYTVFVTDGTGEIGWTKHSLDGSSITGMAIKSDAGRVFIVANAGDLTSTITTKAALDSYLLNMNGAGNQFSGRVATGNSSAIVFTSSGSTLTANVEVDLTFVAARITLTINNGMTGYDAANTNDELSLKQVAVLNAVRDSKLFGSSLMGSPAHYLAGIDASADFNLWPAAGSYTLAADLYSNTIPQNDFSTTYYYYVFENDAISAGEHPTIVTLVAEFDGDTIYYPVHLASYEQWTTGSGSVVSIERGKSYDITITLTVDPANPGGTTDPTTPDADANIDIDVKLNDWVPVTLNKEF